MWHLKLCTYGLQFFQENYGFWAFCAIFHCLHTSWSHVPRKKYADKSLRHFHERKNNRMWKLEKLHTLQHWRPIYSFCSEFILFEDFGIHIFNRIALIWNMCIQDENYLFLNLKKTSSKFFYDSLRIYVMTDAYILF